MEKDPLIEALKKAGQKLTPEERMRLAAIKAGQEKAYFQTPGGQVVIRKAWEGDQFVQNNGWKRLSDEEGKRLRAEQRKPRMPKPRMPRKRNFRI